MMENQCLSLKPQCSVSNFTLTPSNHRGRSSTLDWGHLKPGSELLSFFPAPFTWGLLSGSWLCVSVKVLCWAEANLCKVLAFVPPFPVINLSHSYQTPNVSAGFPELLVKITFAFGKLWTFELGVFSYPLWIPGSLSLHPSLTASHSMSWNPRSLWGACSLSQLRPPSFPEQRKCVHLASNWSSLCKAWESGPSSGSCRPVLIPHSNDTLKPVCVVLVVVVSEQPLPVPTLLKYANLPSRYSATINWFLKVFSLISESFGFPLKFWPGIILLPSCSPPSVPLFHPLFTDSGFPSRCTCDASMLSTVEMPHTGIRLERYSI